MKERIVLKLLANDLGVEVCKISGGTVTVFSQTPSCHVQTDENLYRFIVSLSSLTIPKIVKYYDAFYGIVRADSEYLVFGPFLFDLPVFVVTTFTDNGQREKTDAPILTVSSVLKCLSSLYELYNEVEMDVSAFFSKNFTSSEKIIQNEMTNVRMKYMEELSGHHSLAPILRLQECVRTGDLKSIGDATREIMTVARGVTSKDEFRNQKNMSIAGITHVTRAAIDGGIHYELAYALSDSYIQQFELASDSSILDSLYLQACIDFTKLVYDYKRATSNMKIENNYYTEKAKSYISEHLHEKIEVKDIANRLGITPNYLSAVFKKNEQVTLTEYIFQEKIRLSKHMIIYSDADSSEIAFRLGFASQSHFCQIFKKYTGLTPRSFGVKYKTEH